MPESPLESALEVESITLFIPLGKSKPLQRASGRDCCRGRRRRDCTEENPSVAIFSMTITVAAAAALTTGEVIDLELVYACNERGS